MPEKHRHEYGTLPLRSRNQSRLPRPCRRPPDLRSLRNLGLRGDAVVELYWTREHLGRHGPQLDPRPEATVLVLLPLRRHRGHEPRWFLGLGLQQFNQRPVHVRHHVAHRQIVRVLSEWDLDGCSDVVHCPEREHGDERDQRRPEPLLEQERCDDGREHRLDQEQDGDHLCVWEGEQEFRNFTDVVQIHDAPGELLEDARDHRRRHREHSGVHVFNDEALNPLQDDLHLVCAVAQKLQAFRL
mmetsp:Transcript_121028/g.302000  ORF Transcript_121028/g.302000 Transcript_121028/m.302000 type:complete len:242 (-) Transcript_121028:557-1282(-)